MSAWFGVPAMPLDARLARDEEVAAARSASSTQAQGRRKGSTNSNSNSMPATNSNATEDETVLHSILPSSPKPNMTDSIRIPPPPGPGRRHLATPDPIAFRYLVEEEHAVSVVEPRTCVSGYELYVVEQWVCSRKPPATVIATFTGDENHSIVVGVLSIPRDEREWTPRIQHYFRTMQQFHARPKTTPYGDVMATNLSSFPSALTVIAVSDGDLRNHRQEFVVNEDLKRLGCSGRSGLTLSAEPTRATQEKFQSLYHTSERIPFCESVIELIKQCQTALFLFGMLELHYVDGLLCDVTETAIGDWWTEVGAEYYNAEPTDGILGPTTVAALLGMLMGARNRLAWYGASVPKDVFDINGMKKGIGSFQKDMKLPRTRRLDHQTLRRLHGVTLKAAAGEGGWGVQKAIKSTVEGFGGRRGELVFGMVGGKDKGNVGDIETLDIDKFVSLLYGERTKWLWYGKTRRSAAATGSAPGAENSSSGYHHHHKSDSATDITSGFFSLPDAASAPSRPVSGPPDGEEQGAVSSSLAAAGAAAAAVAASAGSTAMGTGLTRIKSGSESAAAAAAGAAGGGQGAAAGTDTEEPVQRKDTNKSTMYSSVAPTTGSAASIPADTADRDRDRDRDRDSRTRTVFKSVTGRVNDARSGLGRIRDAVGGGLRGHTSRPSRDDTGGPNLAHGLDGAAPMSAPATYAQPGISSLAQASLSSPVMIGRAFTWKTKPEEYLRRERERERERERDVAMPGVYPKEAADMASNKYGDGLVQVAAAGSQTASPGQGLGRAQTEHSGANASAPRPPDAKAMLAATSAALEAELVSRNPMSTQANGRASHLRMDMAVAATATAATTAAAATATATSGNISAVGSVAGDVAVAGDVSLEGPLLETERCVGPGVVGLLRRHSLASARREAPQLPHEVVWPRRLSFSTAEEAILTWEELVDYDAAGWDDSSSDEEEGGDEYEEETEDDEVYEEADEEVDIRHNDSDNEDDTTTGNADDIDDPDETILADQHTGLATTKKKRKSQRQTLTHAPPAAATSPAMLAKFMTAPTLERGLYASLAVLKDVVGGEVAGRVAELEKLDGVYAGQVTDVQTSFFQLVDGYERVQANSQELLGGERGQGAEAVREVEMLMARVEYEIGTLAGKVQDVEEGVRQFTQQVEQVERRAEELKRHLETESWLHWVVRSMTGIGTGPNVVGSD